MLGSLNVHHGGAGKMWYFVGVKDRDKLLGETFREFG